MMRNNMYISSALGRLITVWTLIPVYWDAQAARISSILFNTFSRSSRKLTIGTPLLLLGVVLVMLGSAVWGIITLSTAVLILGPPIKARLLQFILVWRFPVHKPDPVPTTFTRDALLKLGIKPPAVDNFLSHYNVGNEVLIAEIDQQNRMLGRNGSIPSPAAFSVDHRKFEKRQRHKIEVVVVAGILAIKKTYRDYKSFTNELLALSTLASIPAVPNLVAVKPSELTIYQSFLPGKNLGSILSEYGITDEDQFRLSYRYPGIGNWSDEAGVPSERSHIVACTQATLKPSHIDCLSKLLTAVHRAGVAIKDVKYGNIIIDDNQVFMCDFDGAEVFRSNSRRFTKTRELENDKFNYLFGTCLQTTTVQLAVVNDNTHKRDDLLDTSIYYGNGYGIGKTDSIERGSGKWLFIRRAIPDLRDKTVLDLGCRNGMLPLEMLRAGARKVTAYEPDPAYSVFSELNHKWFELVDNRAYDFDLVQRDIREACDRDLTTYDVATAFYGLIHEEPEEIKRIVTSLSQAVKLFIVQCNESPMEQTGFHLERSSLPYLQTLLSENGFPKQKVFSPPYYSRPLIISRP